MEEQKQEIQYASRLHVPNRSQSKFLPHASCSDGLDILFAEIED